MAGSALVSVYNGGFARQTASMVLGTLLVYTNEVLDVREDAVLVSAEPAKQDAAIELLDARITTVRAADGRPTGFFDPGGGCFQGWPPAGFGHAVPVKGVTVHKGERIAVSFYVRATSPGTRSSDGTRMVYRTLEDSRLKEQRFSHGINSTMEVVPTPEELPTRADMTRPPPCADEPKELLLPPS
jgi:hypothetical protein